MEIDKIQIIIYYALCSVIITIIILIGLSTLSLSIYLYNIGLIIFEEYKGYYFTISFLVFASSILFIFIFPIFLAIIYRLFFLGKREGRTHVLSPKNISFFYLSCTLSLSEFFLLKFIRGTPLIIFYYKLMGATIGKGTIITTTRINDPDLTTIGNNCIIGGDSQLNGHIAQKNYLIRKRIIIGNNVTIGQSASIFPGSILPNNCVVGAQSLVPRNFLGIENQVYLGVPIRSISDRHIISSSKKQKSLSKKELPSYNSVSSLDETSLILESYKLRHNEILSLESFFNRVIITSISAFAAILVYAINFEMTNLIGFLPTLVALVGILLSFITVGINTLGFYLSQLEKKLNTEGFDWEMTWGAMGNNQALRTPSVILVILLLFIYISTFWLTYDGKVVDPEASFIGFDLTTFCIYSSTISGIICGISLIGLFLRTLSMSSTISLK
ncbi:hypothetical protein QA596_12825 [Balneolales bacterium ANBcel1]|nr:hypothetical protein [Balneolales bacterium ANBcel1]